MPMTPFAKVLLGAAVVCFVLWGIALALGLQPLLVTKHDQIIYGEGETFYSDAVAYRKPRNDAFLIVNLPQARPAYRWWTVDLAKQAISLSGPPRSLGPARYVLKGDLDGSPIGGLPKFRSWSIRHGANGAAFSGDGFTCSIQRTK